MANGKWSLKDRRDRLKFVRKKWLVDPRVRADWQSVAQMTVEKKCPEKVQCVRGRFSETGWGLGWAGKQVLAGGTRGVLGPPREERIASLHRNTLVLQKWGPLGGRSPPRMAIHPPPTGLAGGGQ